MQLCAPSQTAAHWHTVSAGQNECRSVVSSLRVGSALSSTLRAFAVGELLGSHTPEAPPSMLRLGAGVLPNPKRRRVRAVAPSLRSSADNDACFA